jgi:hypothetical protein
MEERMAKHQAAFHDKLKITADQEPAWQAFIAATKPQPHAMPQPQDRKAMAQMSTPERMEKGLQMMKEHQARMEAHLAAVKTFYAALKPEQQKIFDEAHRHMMHHRHGRHGWGGHAQADGKPAQTRQ